ncbi:hypothetical protein [Protaetiibacter mangrovi]|uniref:Uncharacterized protein n=1 Tax=Protaetiibacter mangrovi TaxID=2970926 RepID=A0ABT1ZE38_9MICO|nr:hypothetical protein [Protaetiibacter mangrovi]MCS0498973.1 hypothetical protein [Protaetiibacter mangrovi]TPX02989.1 hypothetical protein FJ656_19525 [Schumannella luteola]
MNMRALHYAGCELVTTERVAEALLDYIVTLPLNQPPERVTIPALRGGEPVVAELVLTAATPLATTSLDMREQPLDGEDYAVEVLRFKAHRLDSVGFDLR